MDIRRDDWFGDVFERSVFRVAVEPNDDPSPELRRHLAEQSSAFYYCKVPTSNVATVRALLGMGFYVVDVSVVFRLGEPLAATTIPNGVDIRHEVRAGECEGLLTLAETSFTYSRLHQDPLLPRDGADRAKREWVRSYVDSKRGDSLAVAFSGESPAGFLAALTSEVDGESVAVIDLIGVGREHRRLGIAGALIADFVARYRGRCEHLQVGTQVANVPSVRLYERHGFTLHQSEYVLHLHVRDGHPVV